MKKVELFLLCETYPKCGYTLNGSGRKQENDILITEKKAQFDNIDNIIRLDDSVCNTFYYNCLKNHLLYIYSPYHTIVLDKREFKGVDKDLKDLWRLSAAEEETNIRAREYLTELYAELESDYNYFPKEDDYHYDIGLSYCFAFHDTRDIPDDEKYAWQKSVIRDIANNMYINYWKSTLNSEN